MQPTSDHEQRSGGSGRETSSLVDDGSPPLSAQRAGEDPAPVPPPHRPPPDTPRTEIIPMPRTEIMPDEGRTAIMPDEGDGGPQDPPPPPRPDPTVPPTPDVPPPPS